MFAVIVTFQVAPEHAAAFEARAVQQAADSLSQEPACKRFDVWASTEEPGKFTFYELYETREAFYDVHIKSAHFAAYQADTSPLVQEKILTVYDRAAALD